MTSVHIDVAANRRAAKWSGRELLGRFLWALARPLFSFSPRPFWAWRRWVLRVFGGKIGPNVHIHPTVDIAIPWNLTIGRDSALGDRVRVYNLGPLRVGERTTISQYVHLCGGTHDHRQAAFPLVKAEIEIGDDVWICADAFIGPGIEVDDGAIVAARAVVVAHVPARIVVGGNPARLLRQRSETPPIAASE